MKRHIHLQPAVDRLRKEFAVARHQGKLWLTPAMIVFAFVEPALVLALIARFSFHAFSIDGVFAALLASLLMNVGCFLTHDWGAGKADKQ